MSSLRQAATVTGFTLRTCWQRLHLIGIAVVGVAGVTLVLVGLLAMADGFRAVFRHAGAEDRLLILRSGSSSELSSRLTGAETDVVREIVQTELGFDAVISPEVYLIASLARSGNRGEANVPVRGVSPAGAALRNRFRISEGRIYDTGQREVIVGAKTVQEYWDARIGSVIRIGREDWRIVGVFQAGGSVVESEVWGDPRMLQGVYDRGNAFQLVYVPLPDPRLRSALETRLGQDKRITVQVNSEAAYYARQGDSVALFMEIVASLVVIGMAGIALAVSLNSMHEAVASRSREIALLRAIGYGALPIMTSVFTEALLLALVGGACGALLAYFLFDGVTLSTLNLAGSFTQVVFDLKVDGRLLGNAVLIALGLGLLSGIPPAVAAMRCSVSAGLRTL